LLQTQEEEAKKLARDKAKELTKAKLDIQKHGGRVGGGIGSSDMKYAQPSAVTAAMVSDTPKMSYQQPDRFGTHQPLATILQTPRRTKPRAQAWREEG
jgi:hypothetical protein